MPFQVSSSPTGDKITHQRGKVNQSINLVYTPPNLTPANPIPQCFLYFQLKRWSYMKTWNNKHSLYFDSFMGGTLYKNAVTSQKAIHPQLTWIVIFLTDYDPFTTHWWKPICFIDTALIQPNEESLFIFSIQPLLLNGSNHKVKKQRNRSHFYFLIILLMIQ